MGQASAGKEGFDAGITTAKLSECIHRVPAAAAGKKRPAKVVAVGAGKPPIFFEPLHGVGVEYLAPDIGVVPGAVAAAEGLIGWRIFAREENGSLTGGAIIEAEAYTQEDAASHSYRG